MKLTTIFDSISTDGQPVISADHSRLDPVLAKQVVEYLNLATQVSRTRDYKSDLLDPAQRVAFASSVSTDGTWYWREELVYYVKHYLLTPSEEFIQHMKDSNFVPTKPSKEQYDDVLVKIGAASAPEAD